MRRIAFAVLTVFALIVGVTAPAASAEPRSDYVYGAEHMLAARDIASTLGDYLGTFDLEVWPDYRSDFTLCSTASGALTTISGTQTEFAGYYWRKDDGERARVVESVYQFASVKAAANAFRTLQRKAVLCADMIEDTDEAGNVTFVTVNSNGKLAAVAGVPTVYVHEDFTNVLDDGKVYDTFSTYSLVDDGIVQVSFRRDVDGSLTPAETQGVRATTRAAIRAWERSRAPARRSLAANYGYAVGHVISPADVPTTLGRQKLARPLRLSAQTDRIFLCDPQGIQYSDDSQTGPYVGITVPRIQVDNALQSRADPGVQQTVYEFPTVGAARSAFRSMQRQAVRCTGTTTTTSEGDGTSVTIQRTYRAGREAAVKVAGVPSIVIAGSQLVTGPELDTPSESYSYKLLSLSRANIMVMEVSKSSAITSKERRSTQQLAQRAITMFRELA